MKVLIKRMRINGCEESVLLMEINYLIALLRDDGAPSMFSSQAKDDAS